MNDSQRAAPNGRGRGAMRRLTALLMLLLSGFGGGCGTTYDAQAQYEFEDGVKLAILPVKDPEFGGYFSSPRGQELAVLASETLAAELDPKLVMQPVEYMERFREMERKWLDKRWTDQLEDGSDPARLTEQQIADRLTADFVLFASIEPDGWELRAQGAVNMYRGRSRLTARLYDNRGLKLKLVGVYTVKGRYPFSYMGQDGLPTMNAREEDIEDGLKRVTGRYMAELFYDHDKDISIGVTFK
jgi:hypothetical protein